MSNTLAVFGAARFFKFVLNDLPVGRFVNIAAVHLRAMPHCLEFPERQFVRDARNFARVSIGRMALGVTERFA